MKSVLIILSVIAIAFPCDKTVAQTNSLNDSILRHEFNLGGERTKEEQFFIMQTTFINYQLNGKRAGHNTYKLFLKYTPASISGKEYDEYTCTKFVINLNDTSVVSIPALKDWTYKFKRSNGDIDEKGQVLGIDHAKFENLIDSKGNSIQQVQAYLIYNTFIDFHSFCDIFADRTFKGKGIQDLRKIGQKIIHESANSEPPVNLGSNIAKGSYFKNGEITLLLKGVSLVNDKTCALVGFDSGESSFYMKMNVAKDLEIQTIGSSHYKGDLYIDMKSNWVQKVIMDEFVLSETKLPFPPNKINSATERNTVIENVSKEKFSED